MKITDVNAFVLDAGKNYSEWSETGECRGPRYYCLVKVETDEGLTGWSDIETQPHVGLAYLDHPSGDVVGFESLKAALVGEDPIERERLWQKNVSRTGLFRTARRGHAHDFRDRHRLVGHRRKSVWPARVQAARSPV